MGASAPSDDTQKRCLIDGLHDPKAKKKVSWQRPTNLQATRQEACNWEEVQLSQQHHRELLHGLTKLTPLFPPIVILDFVHETRGVQPQVVVYTNPTSYMLPNPYVSTPAYMLQTRTPPTKPLAKNEVVKIVADTFVD